VDHVDEWFSVFFIIYRCVVGASLATDMVGLTALLHGQQKSMGCFWGTYCNEWCRDRCCVGVSGVASEGELFVVGPRNLHA